MPLKAESFAAKNNACTCAWKGCGNTGEYRAPRDKELRTYFVFCLEHVRAYNASWDYHKGATTAELEAEIRSAATWERPTWKLGTLGGGRRRFIQIRWHSSAYTGSWMNAESIPWYLTIRPAASANFQGSIQDERTRPG